MRFQYLPLLALPLFLCTCGPADDTQAVSGLPYEMEWGLVQGAPVGQFSDANKYGGFRLEIAGDSARLYQPLMGFGESYRAYAADSTARFSDPLYLTYTMPSDTSLRAVVRGEDGRKWEQIYVPVPKLPTAPLPESLIGQTYRFELDDTAVLLNFREGRSDLQEQGVAADLLFLKDGVERQTAGRVFGLSKRNSSNGTISAYYGVKSRADGTLRHNILLVSATGEGGVQAYRLLDDDRQRVVEGPFPMHPYSAIVPEDVTQEDLLPLLNQGRVVAEKLTAEPDSVGLRYDYEDAFERIGVIREQDLEYLDFEFQPGGDYHVFVGDRLLVAGKWELSSDRIFIVLRDPLRGSVEPRLIQSFGAEAIAFPIDLPIRTREERGDKLSSYYEAEVMLHFTRGAR